MSKLLDLSILRHQRSFRLLYSGQFISFLGAMITMVALPFQIYDITQSTFMVGMLSFVQLLPLLFTALLGGVLADRYERRYLLLMSESLLAISCIILAVNALLSTPSITLIFIISALMSAITGLHRPAFDGAIQQLLSKKDYKPAAALRAFQMGFGSIVGPSIAGIIIATFGVPVTYLIDFSTFIWAIISLILLGTIPKPEIEHTTSVMSALKEGLQFAWSRQVLLGSYSVDFFAMVFAIPNALFPAIAQNFGGAKTLGLLYAAPAVGMLLLSIWSGWTKHIKHDGQAIAISAILWGMATIGFGLSSSLPLSLFLLALSGAFDTSSGIFRVNLWNSTIPHHFRGRLAGIEMLSYVCGPKLGDTRAGIMAAALGNTTTLISGGILCIASVIICCNRMKIFWNYSSDES